MPGPAEDEIAVVLQVEADATGPGDPGGPLGGPTARRVEDEVTVVLERQERAGDDGPRPPCRGPQKKVGTPGTVARLSLPSSNHQRPSVPFW